jgi:hypothetical protein
MMLVGSAKDRALHSSGVLAFGKCHDDRIRAYA